MCNEKFSANVKKIIKESGKTQIHIARKCGYSQTQMCDLVHGRRVIRPEDVMRLCVALEVDPNKLFGYPIDNLASS